MVRTPAIGLLIAPWLAGALAAQTSPRPDLREFQWLTGSRALVSSQLRIEEQWTAPAANMILGLSRTLRDGRVVEFEFLRIERRDDGVYYVAQPNGGAPTEFRLTAWDGTEALFENPEHDFPRRIFYRRMEDGSVTARIDGGAGTRAREFHFRWAGGQADGRAVPPLR